MTLPLLFDLNGKRIYVAGHKGMVGSAIVRRLAGEGCEVLTADRKALDLTDQKSVEEWLSRMRPDGVFLAAGKVGGIYANDTYPADFITDNLAIALNTIRAAHATGVKKLLALGSSCIYPKLAPQPMREDALLTGPLEPTNEWYAVAKIAAIKLCQAYRKQHGDDFISVMPTNLYGRNDNYHPQNSHVPAALIRRFHEAKLAKAPSVAVWGTGSPRREFLCVDDLADACVFVMKLFRRRVPQHRDRHRSDRRRICRCRRRCRRLPGQDRVRHIASGRHAAQTARRFQARKARLASQDFFARGSSGRL